jgi:hypothetical protein
VAIDPAEFEALVQAIVVRGNEAGWIPLNEFCYINMQCGLREASGTFYFVPDGLQR